LRVVVQLLIAVLMLAGAGAAYWHYYGFPWEPKIGGGAVGAAGPPAGFAIPVETAKVTVGPIERRLSAVGSLLSAESVVIKPEIDGRVVDIRFKEGLQVAKGQMLVQLDPSVNAAEIQSAEAALELARANFERAEDLLQRGSGTQANYDQMRADVRSREAGLALAQAHLQKLTLTAPFSGVVGLRKVSVGDFVESGDEIVNLEQINPLKVDFRVAENFLEAVRPGQRIEITVDAFGQERFAGEVYAIDPLVDVSGRSVLLRATLPNPDLRLRPGLFARVELVLNEKDKAVQIPEQAIVPQGGKQFVFRVEEGKAKTVEVKTGIRREGMVEILAGLGPEDEVVVAGQLKIRDGAPVQNAAPPSA
jgi:membrane fusion protein (multidrug efflux system)